MRNIYLHLLNGFEFEKLITELFRLHGYNVVNMPYTGDAGRDIIIEKEDIRTLVECKHQKSAIGRPVVQKLHSAIVVDMKANQGILVTTGSFSKQAIEYIGKHKVPIKLMNLSDLRKFALEVDTRLQKNESVSKDFTR